MFGLTISPKAIIACIGTLAVLGLVYYGWSSYQGLEQSLADAEKTATDAIAARDNVVAINAGLNSSLIEALKDASDKEQINKEVTQQQQDVSEKISTLKDQLKAESDKRKLAESKSNSPLCIDPRPKPPEVDITWKAYCTATNDPKCSTGSTSP